jgi:hypothetical protein
MNRILLYLPVILLFLSCKKDDPKDLIIGTWQAGALTTKNCTDIKENQSLTFTSGCFTENSVGVKICINATFSANGTYDFVFKTTVLGSAKDTDMDQGTYSINGNTLTLCPDADGSNCEENKFTITENTLTISSVDTDTGCDSTLTLIK